jgi:hypothetical protein
MRVEIDKFGNMINLFIIPQLDSDYELLRSIKKEKLLLGRIEIDEEGEPYLVVVIK